MKVKDYYHEKIMNDFDYWRTHYNAQIKKPKQMFDVKRLENIQLADVDSTDYPDFSDAYVESADIDGRPLTENELEWLADNGGDEIANEMALEWLLD